MPKQDKRKNNKRPLLWDEPKSMDYHIRVTPTCHAFLKEKGADWLEKKARGKV